MKASIEALEARLVSLKQDSKMCTYRISKHQAKRAKIQLKIQEVKKDLEELRSHEH